MKTVRGLSEVVHFAHLQTRFKKEDPETCSYSYRLESNEKTVWKTDWFELIIV